MFNNYFPQQEPEPQQELDLKTITRYSAFFALGVFIAQVARVWPELQPFFWIVTLVGLGWLGNAIRVKQDIRLMAVAAVVIAALLAGHWDGLFHNTAQGLANLREGIQR